MSSYPATASAWCSSYIRPTISETSTTTRTFTTLITYLPETTIIKTITLVDTITTLDYTSTVTRYIHIPPPPPPLKGGPLPQRKRHILDLEPRQASFTPNFLTAFSPYALSTGCSCFVNPLPSAVPEVVTTVTWTREVFATTTLPSTESIITTATATSYTGTTIYEVETVYIMT
ncbi:hypothetical protein NA56DRAFT_646365 [Hyaloscypha hepaticicola]|uniref:Uncharacterized protein n=1 Tax=Hyaloscypha hepaticicola TaxID=2082293 RepID=A0A2J6Q374_9HELO|nr:hypothetical protein NA56DRAFT_646365 [Hyaloscypha hepaticicola]